MEQNESPNMKQNERPNMEHNDSNIDVDLYANTDSEAEDMDNMYETYIEDVNINSIDIAE